MVAPPPALRGPFIFQRFCACESLSFPPSSQSYARALAAPISQIRKGVQAQVMCRLQGDTGGMGVPLPAQGSQAKKAKPWGHKNKHCPSLV